MALRQSIADPSPNLFRPCSNFLGCTVSPRRDPFKGTLHNSTYGALRRDLLRGSISPRVPNPKSSKLQPLPPASPAKVPERYASGEDILPFPEIKCNEILTNPFLSQVDNRTFVELIMGGNNDTSERLVSESMDYIVKILRTPDMTQTESGIMAFNETLVRWYYRLMKLEFSYCYEAARFKLQSPSGREYNALQFGGTMDLVQDIDVFRRAVGAPKLSIYGMSYGTAVAGVYGTVFPENTQHLILDGVVDPFPDVQQRGDLFAKGITATFNGFVKACDQTIQLNLSKDEICPAAPLSETKAIKMIQDSSQPFRAALLYLLADLAIFQKGGDENIEAVAALFLACVEMYWSGVDSEDCPALLEYLVPSDDAPIILNEDLFDFGMQAMVMGTDTAGRLNEEAMIQWWKESMAKQPIGTPWALTWVVGISTWPADARPVPPLGNGQVSPVIIGNLHDPNTAYTSAQLARSAFPRGHLVTYQGYGHCLDKSKLAGLGKELYDSYQQDVANHHLSTYSNQMALYACSSRILNYIATGEQPLDGHTCLVPHPLRTGSAMAMKGMEVLFASSSEQEEEYGEEAALDIGPVSQQLVRPAALPALATKKTSAQEPAEIVAEPVAAEPGEPVAAEPAVQPVAAEPVEPVAAEPVEPVAAEPVEPVAEPVAAEPVEPVAAEPAVEPVAAEPEPVEPVTEPVVAEPEPVAEPVEPVSAEPVAEEDKERVPEVQQQETMDFDEGENDPNAPWNHMEKNPLDTEEFSNISLDTLDEEMKERLAKAEVPDDAKSDIEGTKPPPLEVAAMPAAAPAPAPAPAAAASPVAAEAAAEPVAAEPVEPVAEPVEPMAVEPVAAEPVEPVAEPVEPVAADTEPVAAEPVAAEPVQPVAEPVEPVAAEPVEPVAAEPVEPVTEPVEPVAAEPAEPVEPVAAEPQITEPVATAAEPRTEPAAQPPTQLTGAELAAEESMKEEPTYEMASPGAEKEEPTFEMAGSQSEPSDEAKTEAYELATDEMMPDAPAHAAVNSHQESEWTTEPGAVMDRVSAPHAPVPSWPEASKPVAALR
ncbi:caeA [Symbiodinium sp. CCMP2456]|nr:caeA [Symbiodinium sp. CCMP2456]